MRPFTEIQFGLCRKTLSPESFRSVERFSSSQPPQPPLPEAGHGTLEEDIRVGEENMVDGKSMLSDSTTLTILRHHHLGKN